MKQQFKNGAKSTLASSITNVATSLAVQSGHGARFPAIASPQYFRVVLERATTGEKEYVKVTARSTDTFTTIVRAEEGSSALTFSAGDYVELRPTAAVFTDFFAEFVDDTYLAALYLGRTP